ncbi:metal cation symporter ZIP14-like [Dreissena polymorpha]|uniref:metal cation symporter ZIP14-like n=1 Tax=Dreissena polymorpha TaxID=45954 RepID=UPI002264346D|nr:metal cation symporter ZIP14-like [Dreissena polymorpha]XP_052280034.1 metal cation symporter ZIP14-like [Dreissena polymorpha]
MDFSSFPQTRDPLLNKNVDGLPHLSPCGENDSSGSDKDSTGTSRISIREIDQVRDENTQEDLPLHVRKPHHHNHRKVQPVAWMIIFGDALHNFIDGISIGAAFTESILAGVSVSIAIFCEELPHELGDFAVLLNAGMRMKKALMYNFMSACMCYLGLIVGIFLGENTAAHTWVFAFAGGMFLYISLVDMLPEMNAATEVEDNKNMNHFTIYILQNLGLLTGFGLMLIMAIYGGSLENAIKGIS